MGKVYIRSMDKKPDHCAECPICNGDDDCWLLPRWYSSWESQYADCPLDEETEREQTMKVLTINPSNKPYYSDDFIKGFECGTQRQFDADLTDRPQEEWDRGFYEFLCNNVILPNDMQKYIEMYEAQPVAVDGARMKGACDEAGHNKA